MLTRRANDPRGLRGGTPSFPVATWAMVAVVGCSSAPPGPTGQDYVAGAANAASNRGGSSGSSTASTTSYGGTNASRGGALALGGVSAGATSGSGTTSSTAAGAFGSGGNAKGGNSNNATGGVSAAGVSALGGAASGGKASSGTSSGGTATGGKASGGSAMGGAATGGRATGGSATGAAATGGTAIGGTNSAGSAGCLGGPAVVVPSGYQLVWADEFNVDGAPDPSNWGYETGFVRNEEAQWYQSDNARVDKGCLVIEGRRERKTNPNYSAGSSSWKTNRQYAEYTSSSLRTMGKRTWQYGRFEMRGRIKTQAGLWPAWWTLGVAKEWPSCGEIDIMEYYAGMVRANVACGTATQWQAKWDGVGWNVATFDDKNWQNEFHVWRMDWDDTKIDLLLDDKLVNTSKLSDMLNADGSSPFKQAHYMLVNLAIGGNNGGDPASTIFPSRYEVDYIRVFQKQ